MLNTNPAFTSIFQKAWDEILSKQDIMVIICSSYINMMAKQVLAENSPLYGRRTSQIRLAPLPFFDIRQHYQNKPFSDVVELYSVTGGVPKYLEFFDNKNSLMDNISRVILNKNGFLYEEPTFLLHKEVKEPVNYYSVMKAQTIGDSLGNVHGRQQIKSLSGNFAGVILIGKTCSGNRKKSGKKSERIIFYSRYIYPLLVYVCLSL